MHFVPSKLGEYDQSVRLYNMLEICSKCIIMFIYVYMLQ